MKRTAIILSFIVPSLMAQAASFDCAKASTPMEKTICTDNQLSDLDSQLAQVYQRALADPLGADSIKNDQKVWLKSVRNKCADVECLTRAYTERIGVLNSLAPTTPTEKKDVSEPSSSDAISLANTTSSGAESNTPAIMPESQATTTPAEKPDAATSNSSVSTSAATSSTSSSPDVKPPSLIADISNSVISLTGLLILLGLAKPAWILRWDKKPTRAKVIGYLFPIGFLFGGIATIARTDERKAYDAKIIAAKKAEDEARTAQLEKERAADKVRQASSALEKKCVNAALDEGYVDGMCAYSYINACVTTQSRSEMNRMLAVDKMMEKGRVNFRGCTSMPTTYVNTFNAELAKRDKF